MTRTPATTFAVAVVTVLALLGITACGSSDDHRPHTDHEHGDRPDQDGVGRDRACSAAPSH